ncbi:TraK family protein [Maridesulfovibrio frigidus]|uniref:TraK family protein n=1 Tax=Maridesulfovibrio frigidus TaxID=340956 RepID=UPI0004E26A3B|nr:TraK family protein [Maridesulfovibrio frigidus]
MKRNERGFAKVEFLANIAKIKDLASKGYSKKAVYHKLIEAGTLSVSYSHFCRFDLSGNISKTSNFTPGVPNTRSAPALASAISAKNCEGGSPKGSSLFVHKKAVTDEDLEQELVGE